MFLGAITVSYNLSGVKSGLRLDGKTLGDIFMGKVKTWNDTEIKALNPGISLPSTPITVVHRSDSSGTTAGFTGFLAAVDPEFKSKVGEGKEVPWPTGTGAKGNSGVAGAVKQTEGAVGYVEQAYALQNNFTYASVQNKAGHYVLPTLQSTTAAGEGVKIPAEPRHQDQQPARARAAYPITSQTFIVVNKDICKAGVPGGEEAAKDVVEVHLLRARRRPEDPLAGRLRGAAGADPGQVEGGAGRAAVQRLADRELSAMTRPPRSR